jgi:hypothetical protein
MSRALLFVAVLAGVFGLAFGAGRVADPDTVPTAAHEGGGHDADGHDQEAAAPAEVHLALTQRSYAPGRQAVSFQVQDRDGRAVTAYDVQHEKELHLIVLATGNLSDFQHVHPTMAADGTWTARLRLGPGQAYRLYADGSTRGSGFVATADVVTTGRSTFQGPVPEPSSTDRVGGLTVRLADDTGSVRMSVTRSGRPVVLEPYLGALGHLVVIRVDDLAYLHVHPEQGAAPEFVVAGLAPGTYRYFFDFQVDGVVHTASFTVEQHQEGSGHDH